jgi:hypothetical protein
MLGLRAELGRDQVLGARAQAVADVVAGNDEIGAVLRDASHQQMDVRIVGVPMRDANPVESGAEIALHLADEVPGEGLEIGHLGGILRGDDEAEMMPVVLAAFGERHGVGAVLGGAEHVSLLAAAGDAVALQIGDVSGERRRAESAAPVADHPGLDDDATLGAKEPAAAERNAAAAEL